MSYPEQIRKQFEEAEELEKRMRGEIPADTPAQDEGTPAEPAPEPQPDSDLAPTDPQPGPEPSPASTPEPDNEWKAKYDALLAEVGSQPLKTLQGKYSSEVPRMAEEIRELKKQIEQLSKPKEEKKGDTPPPMSKAIGELAATYGDAFVDALRDLAREEFAHLLPDAVKPLEEKVGGVEKMQTQTASERFVSSLIEAHPDLPSLNYDEGFLAWLRNNKVPFTDTPLSDALKNAEAKHNSSIAIQIINAYKESSGLTNKQPEPEPPPEPPTKILPTPDVAPPRSRTVAPPAGKTEPKIWTQAEVRQAYTDATRGGKYTAEQWAAVEAEINKAMLEGRIR